MMWGHGSWGKINARERKTEKKEKQIRKGRHFFFSIILFVKFYFINSY